MQLIVTLITRVGQSAAARHSVSSLPVLELVVFATQI